MNLVQNNKNEFSDLIPNIDLNSDPAKKNAALVECFGVSPELILPSAGFSPQSIEVRWAITSDEVIAAQRLRHSVFNLEMGGLPANSAARSGLDIDLFDEFCEHLIVLDAQTKEVIGTYRVLTPTQAQRVGSTHLETLFDLTRLRQYKEHMVEIGKGCVHPAHRNGGVIMALWGELFKFMRRNKLDLMVGSTNIPMTQSLPLSAKMASSIWTHVKEHHLAAIQFHVRPRRPLPVEQLGSDLPVELPPLIQAYLRLGAKVLGPPAWLANSNSVDLPMMMRSTELHSKYQKHFLGL
jgi:putative hemolysin